MSDAVQIAAITGFVASIPAIGAVLIAWWSMRAKQEEIKLETAKLAAKQDELKSAQDALERKAELQIAETKTLHGAVNSQMDKFKQVLADAEFAKGDLAGRAALESEQRDKALAVMESQKKIANGGHEPEPKATDKATLVEVVNADKKPVPVDVVDKEKKP